MAGVFVVGVIGGSALMYNNSVYDAVNDALGKGATQNAVGSIDMTQINVSSMDLETAMMAVQSNRANLLEQQLKEQIESVQAKNDQIAKLNQVLNTLNVVAGRFNSDAGKDTPVPNAGSEEKQRYADVQNAIKNAGLTDAVPSTKGQLEVYIQQIKSMIDAQSNSQQMDMLRLQSLSNKRNEAFDVMTNFVKKMSDSRSSIIGNMR
ncbi:hypothetical protein [Cohnella sp. 56]|uniref:hypothetical protein n=1 Tax=Cohnella sp. 56 TaxID=3113722 RepID=UPI0030E7CD05